MRRGNGATATSWRSSSPPQSAPANKFSIPNVRTIRAERMGTIVTSNPNHVVLSLSWKLPFQIHRQLFSLLWVPSFIFHILPVRSCSTVSLPTYFYPIPFRPRSSHAPVTYSGSITSVIKCSMKFNFKF